MTLLECAPTFELAHAGAHFRARPGLSLSILEDWLDKPPLSSLTAQCGHASSSY